jgi:hypothetical protein
VAEQPLGGCVFTVAPRKELDEARQVGSLEI